MATKQSTLEYLLCCAMDVRLEALSLHFDGNLEGVYTSATFSSLRLLYDQSPFFLGKALDMRLKRFAEPFLA